MGHVDPAGGPLLSRALAVPMGGSSCVHASWVFTSIARCRSAGSCVPASGTAACVRMPVLWSARSDRRARELPPRRSRSPRTARAPPPSCRDARGDRGSRRSRSRRPRTKRSGVSARPNATVWARPLRTCRARRSRSASRWRSAIRSLTIAAVQPAGATLWFIDRSSATAQGCLLASGGHGGPGGGARHRRTHCFPPPTRPTAASTGRWMRTSDQDADMRSCASSPESVGEHPADPPLGRHLPLAGTASPGTPGCRSSSRGSSSASPSFGR